MTRAPPSPAWKLDAVIRAPLDRATSSSCSHRKLPPVARVPAVHPGMFLVGIRGTWSRYVAERRPAGLPFDYAPLVSLAVVLGVAVAACLGALGF